ncbi:selenocysteine-specific translation elongation factor [Deferrisoma camini]|uniref:selenocysteine-specific translation elongation factor n=1 Tax=Deferrisoma camini TaxID=1035120 RepID=UPI00046C9F03|nr:selenocysteine-specific translation elongation factor [Deferrisoma camini]
MRDAPRLTLGTAGHIDHGKTSLVRALTGTDTDRLKEEKERGITIELGFAHLELPGGTGLSVVDVPGHERFVKNMVAGAAGIDLVLLVVAADEGVMPQTREHLDICRLLGVQHGLVALTKADTVDPDFLELARDDVEQAVQGTFLEGAPIVPVSSVTGEGLDVLLRELDSLASRVPPRGSRGVFRLPVDRVFTIRGFGTVVTGTVISGSARRDDEAVVLPADRGTKIRNIQVHGRDASKAVAGQRAALNLAGLDVGDLERGVTVAHPGTLAPTRMVDVHLELLPGEPRPLADRARVRLHVGTQEVPVVVALLEGDQLAPGEAAYAQLRSAEWIVTCPGDRFVLRSFSPPRTLGGGVVLDHQPRRHRGKRPDTVRSLEVLHRGEPGERLGAFLAARGYRGLTPQEAQVALGTTLEEARNQLQAVVRSGVARVTDRKTQRHHHRAVVDELAEKALGLLARFHAENPLRRGLGREELRGRLPRHADPKLVEYVLGDLNAQGRIAAEGNIVRLAEFVPQLDAGDEEARSRILGMLGRRRFEGPTQAELASELGLDERTIRPVVEYLVEQGAVHRTKEGYLFRVEDLDALAAHVVELFRRQPEIGVADIKAFTGTTRKYTIPLLEYLDGRRVTVRRGDVRVPGPRAREGGA